MGGGGGTQGEDRSVGFEVEWSASHKIACPKCGRACADYYAAKR